MPLDLKNDFLLFDGAERITLVQAGTGKKQVINYANQFGITNRDAAGSDGTYRTGDVKWNLPTAECLVFEPVAGDFLISGTETLWTLGAVETLTLRTRYQGWGKRAELNPNTMEEVRVEKAKWLVDESEAPYAEWKLFKLSNAHINESSSEVVVELERRKVRVTHNIYIVDNGDYFAGMRVVTGKGVIYNVLRVTGKGNMGVATVLDVELARTPQVE